jgi:hypothetical protein
MWSDVWQAACMKISLHNNFSWRVYPLFQIISYFRFMVLNFSNFNLEADWQGSTCGSGSGSHRSPAKRMTGRTAPPAKPKWARALFLLRRRSHEAKLLLAPPSSGRERTRWPSYFGCVVVARPAGFPCVRVLCLYVEKRSFKQEYEKKIRFPMQKYKIKRK